MTSKKELRQTITIRQQSQQKGTVESSAVIEYLLRNVRFREANTVMLYSALPDEVPTQELIDKLAEEGKTIVLPRVTSHVDMELRHYTGRADLQVGAFGIQEPVGEVFTNYTSIDVAVIPGMAFDAHGHRLGRGRGYYDRFLSRVPYIYKIGLCFPWQLVDHVPTDEHDILMDCVISPPSSPTKTNQNERP